MSTWMIYFWLSIDNLIAMVLVFELLSIFGIFSLILIEICVRQTWDYGGSHSKKNKEEFKKIGKILKKWCIPICIISSLFLIFVPDSKNIAAIYLIPKITNNKDVQ